MGCTCCEDRGGERCCKRIDVIRLVSGSWERACEILVRLRALWCDDVNPVLKSGCSLMRTAWVSENGKRWDGQRSFGIHRIFACKGGSDQLTCCA
jgi:hypothetical protein